MTQMPRDEATESPSGHYGIQQSEPLWWIKARLLIVHLGSIGILFLPFHWPLFWLFLISFITATFHTERSKRAGCFKPYSHFLHAPLVNVALSGGLLTTDNTIRRVKRTMTLMGQIVPFGMPIWGGFSTGRNLIQILI
jgi:hypothetical protein